MPIQLPAYDVFYKWMKEEVIPLHVLRHETSVVQKSQITIYKAVTASGALHEADNRHSS